MSVVLEDIKLVINDKNHTFDDFIKQISSIDKLTKEDIFKIIFNGIITPLSGNSKESFDSYVTKLAHIFDLNGDGRFDEKDLEYFKSQDLTKIIYSCTQMIEILHTISTSIFQVQITKDTVINISFRILLYTILLPLCESENFKKFIKDDAGRFIINTILDTLYSTISASSAISGIVDDSIDYITAQISKCTCCKKFINTSKQILSLNKEIDDALALPMKIKNDTQVKTILELKNQLNNLSNK